MAVLLSLLLSSCLRGPAAHALRVEGALQALGLGPQHLLVPRGALRDVLPVRLRGGAGQDFSGLRKV